MAAIFLSHSSKDNAAADVIKARLAERGHRSVFLDFDPADGIPAGREWEQELYARLRACRVFVVLCTEDSMQSPWCFAEITHAKALGKLVIPVKIAPCEVAPILLSRQVVDMQGDIEDGYRRLFAALDREGLDPRQMFDWDGSRPPFPGLLSFGERDAAVFFGREGEIQDGLDALTRLRRLGGARLTMVLGASGCGKSSFVRAGLLPRLARDPDQWLVVAPLRPQTDPLTQLALVLSGALAQAGSRREWRDIREALRKAEDGGTVLLDLATDLRLAADRSEATVLLVVDQFEENLFGDEHSENAVFLRLLAGALRSGGRHLMALGTMRSDFLGQFQTKRELIGLPYEPWPIGPLKPDGLTRVIGGPAEVCGLRLGTGLVEALVADTRSPNALPLLAFTLRLLFDRHGVDGLLTVEQYRCELGSLESAIAKTADQELASPRFGDVEKQALRTAFLALVRINDDGQFVRRIAPWTDLPLAAHGWLERFVKARLLVSAGDKETRTLEVAHEALFTSWDLLHTWLTEKRGFLLWRERLRGDIAEWRRTGGDKGALLRGAVLAEAKHWQDTEGDLSTEELGYIRASLDNEEQEEHRWEELFREANDQRQAAVRAEVRARQALAESRAREFVLEAEASITQNPQLSLRLGIAAAEVARGAPDSPVHDTVRSLLRRVVLATPRRLAADISGVECFVVHPTRPTVVLGTQRDGVVEIALHDGAVLRKFAMGDWVDTVDVSSDGKHLAAGSRDKRVVIWDMARAKKIQTLRLNYAPQSVDWNPDGVRLAVGLANGNDSRTKIFDAMKAKEITQVPGMRASWSPDGRILATGGGDGVVRIFAESGQLMGESPGHNRYVHKIAWRPGGRQFATASVDDTVLVWVVTGFRRVARLPNEFALSVAWSHDGRMLASGGGRRFVTVWDTPSFTERFRITGSTTLTGQEVDGTGAAGYVLDVAWHPDGNAFLVSDRQGGLLVYSPRLFESDTDDDWLATAREQLAGDLSDEDLRRFGLAPSGAPG